MTPRILVVMPGRLYAEAMRRQIEVCLPSAQVVAAQTLASSMSNDFCSYHLLIVALPMEGEDLLSFLDRASRVGRRETRVLILTIDPPTRVALALRALSVDGVFDPSTEPPEAFGDSIEAVMAGKQYWSASIIRRLRETISADQLLKNALTDAEEKVLAAIGDGSDDETAAAMLNLKPSTVQTTRRNIYRKLQISHKGQLVRIAAQLGYIRFTSAGVVRLNTDLRNCEFFKSGVLVVRQKQPSHVGRMPVAPRQLGVG